MSDKRVGSRQSVVCTLCVVLLVAGAGTAWADVRLPAVIGDNMVLQRGQKVPIWGWAQPGEEITVSVSWHNMCWAAATDKDGKWRFEMTPPGAGGPYEMIISGKNSITIKNILVGEVWACSGQSNMQWAVRQSANAEQEIATANYPNIRLFSVQRKVAEQPQSDCVGSWQQCTPQTAADFSAVAYYFGRELHKELNVPIGLIHTSWGGTPAEAWTSRQALEAEQDFAPILQRYDDAVAKYPQAKKEYEQKLAQWQEAVEKAKTEGSKPPPRPGEPFGPGNPNCPAGLYNAMIAPLTPYGIAGAIWYQGESNAGRAYQYRKLLPAMINNWRKDWGRGDFAFLIVQLANFMATKPEPGDSEWAELREAQLLTLALPNTGMAVTIDIGEANDIHPKNKQDVGKRLALWALAKTYGKNLVYSGPIYRSMKVDGNKAILELNHVGGGLVAGGGLPASPMAGEPLKGFAIAGADRKFLWADAKIDGNTVVVGSDKVAEPVAVRYAWADNPVCDLYNKEGLPAGPFRTDDWPGITVGKKEQPPVKLETANTKTLPKYKRLVTNTQFRAVVAGRLCASDGFLVLYIRWNDCGYPRLGVSVGKSCGGAVVRNRVKRLLREAFRQNQGQIPAGFDYLLMISPKWSKKVNGTTDSKRAVRRMTFEQVRTSFLTLVDELRKRRQKARI